MITPLPEKLTDLEKLRLVLWASVILRYPEKAVASRRRIREELAAPKGSSPSCPAAGKGGK